jgi:hypothetical protein
MASVARGAKPERPDIAAENGLISGGKALSYNEFHSSTFGQSVQRQRLRVRDFPSLNDYIGVCASSRRFQSVDGQQARQSEPG